MARIKCGKCKNQHESVRQVRACYDGAAFVSPFDQFRVAPGPAQSGRDAVFQQFRADTALLDRPVAPISTVPASKYSLERADGVLEFFQVDAPTKGKWAGHRFVSKLIGAPGDWRKVAFRGRAGHVVLDRIVNDTLDDNGRQLCGAEAAAVRFSREFTRCAVCSSPLSDPESIERGLGPVCNVRFV